MSAPWVRTALRIAAVIIAAAALIDPVFTTSRVPSPSVVVIEAAVGDTDAVVRDLRARGLDVTTRRVEAGGRLPCAPGERCVVVADGSLDAAVPADLDAALSLVRRPPPASPNVRIRSAVFSPAHAAAAGQVRVDLEGSGIAGQTVDVRVLDGPSVVGAAQASWTDDGVVGVDVPWWPLGSGARALRVDVSGVEGESALFDNVLDAGLDVAAGRIPVLVFDARPSWISTFVRRALEDDPRFSVEHRARLAPALTAATPSGRLDAAILQDTSVLIVGAPEGLTSGDVDLIDRFARVRGGTVVLLPSEPPAGAVARLAPGRWSLRLAPDVEELGPLRASELLEVANTPATSSRLAGAVVATPAGAGRVLVATAMDAWRYRGEDESGFDRFWQSIAAEGGTLGRAVTVDLDAALAAAGTRIGVTVRGRFMTPPSDVAASAVMRCGESPAFAVRLHPAGLAGVFRGEAPMPPGTSACEVEAAVNDAHAAGGIAVVASPSPLTAAALAKLERAARESGGVVTDEDNLSPLGEALAVEPAPRAESWAPLRSPWWLLPFAACLSLEWWMRRRTGLH